MIKKNKHKFHRCLVKIHHPKRLFRIRVFDGPINNMINVYFFLFAQNGSWIPTVQNTRNQQISSDFSGF